MDIRGFIRTSLVDWDGEVVSTIFAPGCNFDCGFCYNHALVHHPETLKQISEETVLDYLKNNSDFVDGICISGGEATLQKDLYAFCRKVKEIGLKVKLDTNGSNPAILKKLIKDKLVDYVAMDVKAPLSAEEYEKVIGVKNNYLLDNVKESIRTLLNSDVDYEFRTTVVPTLHTEAKIKEMARSLAGCKKYVLQKFQPENAYDEKLRKERIQSDEEMGGLVKIIKKDVPNARWRGK